MIYDLLLAGSQLRGPAGRDAGWINLLLLPLPLGALTYIGYLVWKEKRNGSL